jgi:hypothetical protein
MGGVQFDRRLAVKQSGDEGVSMTDAATEIKGLTDVQVVAAVRQLNRRVFSDLSFDAVKAATTATGLKTVSKDAAATQLDSAASVKLSRQVLTAAASDPGLAPLVTEVINHVKQDDSLFIETAIAIGVLVNLTMFMASSELNFTSGKLSIHKGQVGADVVKLLVEPVLELIKKVPSVH